MLRISTLGVLLLLSFFSGWAQSFIMSSPSGLVRLKVTNENSLYTNPESYKIEKIKVSNKSKIKIPLAESGGCAISIFE